VGGEHLLDMPAEVRVITFLLKPRRPVDGRDSEGVQEQVFQ
jgi:hypothetical protein